MIGKVITLVLLFAGGIDGGRAVDTGLKFSEASKCEAAATKIEARGKDFNSGYGRPAVAAVCIEQ